MTSCVPGRIARGFAEYCTRSASRCGPVRQTRCGSKKPISRRDEIETLPGLAATATRVQKPPWTARTRAVATGAPGLGIWQPRRRREASWVPLSRRSIGAARPNFGRKIAAVAVKVAFRITIGGLTMWRLPSARHRCLLSVRLLWTHADRWGIAGVPFCSWLICRPEYAALNLRKHRALPKRRLLSRMAPEAFARPFS
jgi:hypothetical protein